MKGKLIIVTGEKCPNCALLIELLNEMKLNYVEFDVDKGGNVLIDNFGMKIRDMYPIPQLFYEYKDKVHYIYLPLAEPKEEIKKIIKKRIEAVEKGLKNGFQFLIQDAKEMQTFDEKSKKLVPLFDEWVHEMQKEGMIVKLKIFGREHKIVLPLLKELIENKFECLCVKNRKCPCNAFTNNGNCICGVFL